MSFAIPSARRATYGFRCPRCRLFGRLSLRIRFFALLHNGSLPAANPSMQQRHPSAVDEADALSSERKQDSLSSGFQSFRSRRRIPKPTHAPAGSPSSPHILGQPTDLAIRTRFAPSPTGYLHLGSLRTALFNKLVAKASKGGAFILRIEDTDQSRIVQDAEKRLLEDLRWAGLSWDEGPDQGGPSGPYRQSERLSIYQNHAQQLLRHGHAYRCFCDPHQLESVRREQHDAGKPTRYPGTCRSIDHSESDDRAARGEPHVVRLRADLFGRPMFQDAIYGRFRKKDSEEDFVLIKTDGFPTYHFANVVDDHLMKITHVVRGEEWLISTPKHLALYKAFGWTPPTFAHLGLLVNADGSKLSKRNDSVNVSKYQEDGVLPMALLAWLANLGSSFKPHAATPRTFEDMASALTFKFTRGGIRLNLNKLEYFSTKYQEALLQQPRPDLAVMEERLIDECMVQPMLREIADVTEGQGKAFQQLPEAWQTTLEPVPALVSDKTRADYVHQTLVCCRGASQSPGVFIRQHPYLFWRVPDGIYQSSLATFAPDQCTLDALGDVLEHDKLWTEGGEKAMRAIHDQLQTQGVDQVVMHKALRVVCAGGPDVVSQSSSTMLTVLGKDECRHRLRRVREHIK